MKDIKDKADNEKLKWFFRKYIFPRKHKLIVLICLIFVGSAMANITPYLYGKMLDSITMGDMFFLKKLIIVYFLVTIITTLLSMYEDYLGKLLNFNVTKKVQKNLFDKIIRLRTSSYVKYDTGEFVSRLNGDASSIVSFYINVITSILQIAVNVVISLYFVFQISLRLTSVAIFYIPASCLVTFLIRKHFKALAEKRKVFNDRYYSFQNEIFLNNVGIKSYMLEDKTNQKYKSFISQELKFLKKSVFLNNIMQFLNACITVISSLFVIYVSAILIKQNLLTIGTMVAFNTYINKLFSSISQILGINISKQEIVVCLNRVIKMMSEKSETKNEIKVACDFENPIIASKNISFSYNNGKERVLKDFSLEICSNGFYSFVGKNGCGKSTFAKLLIKLYNIDEGELKINQRDYKDVSKEYLRKNITYIQKEDFFFDDTIYNNMRLGNENATDEEIIDLCKKVGIDDYINTLTDKYETVIGEGAFTLSSGQKQKLSIVRALLRNTKIYVCDEVTANLDGQSEKNVVSIFKKVSKNAIVIFISHKISSIVESDEIFLIDDGKVVDSGMHNKLSVRNPLYNELFKSVS